MTLYYEIPALAFHGLHTRAIRFSPAQFDLFLQYGRAAFLVFSFLLAAVSFTLWRRTAQRESRRSQEFARAVLERLSGIETDLTRIEGSVCATDARVTTLVSRLEENGRTAGTGGSAGYGIAIRMARGGATRDELVAVTGLTQQEADLIIRLHARVAQPSGVAA